MLEICSLDVKMCLIAVNYCEILKFPSPQSARHTIKSRNNAFIMLKHERISSVCRYDVNGLYYCVATKSWGYLFSFFFFLLNHNKNDVKSRCFHANKLLFSQLYACVCIKMPVQKC